MLCEGQSDITDFENTKPNYNSCVTEPEARKRYRTSEIKEQGWLHFRE